MPVWGLCRTVNLADLTVPEGCPTSASVGHQLMRRWALLVAVLVVAIAGFAVYRLQGIFASTDVTSTPSGSANEIVPFNPKHVVMEVFGPPDAVATII